AQSDSPAGWKETEPCTKFRRATGMGGSSYAKDGTPSTANRQRTRPTRPQKLTKLTAVFIIKLRRGSNGAPFSSNKQLKSISLEEIPDKLIGQPALAAAWMLGFLELFNAL